MKKFHFSKTIVRITVATGLMAVIPIGYTAMPALAQSTGYFVSPHRIEQDCAHFEHRPDLGANAPSIDHSVDQKPYKLYRAIAPNGSYADAHKCKTFNVLINGTAGRIVRIVPWWGYYPPANKLGCEQSYVVYRVWRNHPDNVFNHDPVGGTELQGTWVQGNQGEPGFCTWKNVGSVEQTIIEASHNTTRSLGVSARAFFDRQPISYQSVRLTIFVYPLSATSATSSVSGAEISTANINENPALNSGPMDAAIAPTDYGAVGAVDAVTADASMLESGVVDAVMIDAGATDAVATDATAIDAAAIIATDAAP
jgi:hypothetical protein